MVSARSGVAFGCSSRVAVRQLICVQVKLEYFKFEFYLHGRGGRGVRSARGARFEYFSNVPARVRPGINGGIDFIYAHPLSRLALDSAAIIRHLNVA